jgi:hypothetical protein
MNFMQTLALQRIRAAIQQSMKHHKLTDTEQLEVKQALLLELQAEAAAREVNRIFLAEEEG